MTIFEALNHLAGGGLGGLLTLLENVGKAAPDLKPEADDSLAKLNTALTPEGLSAVAAALPKELGEVLHGKLNPREHPSDSI